MGKTYVLLGPPGAGKGTMADMLVKDYGFVHISTGDILRQHIKTGSELGRRAKDYIDAGNLVPDEVVAALVAAKLAEPEVQAQGCLLDGYPRTVHQADLLQQALRENSLTLDAAVLFEVDDELLLKRLTARRICRECGAVYNVLYNPPQAAGVCDDCGGALYQRSDDSAETAQERLRVYQRQTAPLIEYYQSRGKLRRVSGAGGKDDNYQALNKVLGL